MKTIKTLLRFGVPVLLAVILAGCETCEDCTNWTVDVQQNKLDEFIISSPSFYPGDPLPAEFTCEGKNFADGVLPELNWTEGPEGTKSYVIILKDLSLADGDTPDHAYHWVIWDIPASITSLPEALEESPMPEGLGGAQQLSGGPGGPPVYFGPCPSWQVACPDSNAFPSLDTYVFSIYAMDVETLDLPEPNENIDNYVRQLDAFFRSKAHDQAQIIVTSDAAPATAPVFCPNPEDN